MTPAPNEPQTSVCATPVLDSSNSAIVRVHDEPPDPLRTPFELDRHRIIDCTAFRRLEGKTQLFLAGHHDHFRTRLTHSVEVATIARTLARCAHADESLAEAVALAHDLGHPPFGHAGEAALDQAMQAIGGFNHNVHSLRVVELLEHPFPAFRGLNLTAAVRGGLASHATRYDVPHSAVELNSLEGPTSQPIAEAQIASLADRIAYNIHDLEDAIGADLIRIEDLQTLELWNLYWDPHRKEWQNCPLFAIRRAVLDAMLNRLLTDMVSNSSAPRTPALYAKRQGSVRAKPGHQGNTARTEVRGSPPILSSTVPASIQLSEDGEQLLRQVEDFLLERVYRHPHVNKMDLFGRRIVLELIDAYRRKPEFLPSRFLARVEEQGLDRVITDYLAGMTDRFCRREHQRVAG